MRTIAGWMGLPIPAGDDPFIERLTAERDRYRLAWLSAARRARKLARVEGAVTRAEWAEYTARLTGSIVESQRRLAAVEALRREWFDRSCEATDPPTWREVWLSLQAALNGDES